LIAAGEIVDGPTPREEVVPRVLDLVVPALADACLVLDGDGRLAGVRVDGPSHSEIEAAVRARPGAFGGGDLLATGEPVLVEDVGCELRGALARDPEELRLLDRFDLRSAVLAPLPVRGRTTGTMIVATGPSGRRYAADDLRYLGVLAGRLAMALENARMLIVERQLEALVAGMEDAVTVRDLDGRVLLANGAALALAGVTSAGELGREAMCSSFALYDVEGRTLRDEELVWAEAVRTGRSPPARLYRRVDRSSGVQRWLVSKASVVRDDADRVAMVMVVTEDVTVAQRAELGQRLLVEAGRLLSSTVDLDATLQEIAELAVPTLADWCAIDVPGPGSQLSQVAAAHVDPDKLALAQRLRARRPVSLAADGVRRRVLRSGVPVQVNDVAGTSALEAEHLAPLDLRALLVVPLRSGDDVLGTLSLSYSEPHRRFDDAEQELAEALAWRIGDALRNASLLHNLGEVAHVLSAGLRPEVAPVLPGCAVRAVYRPAGEGVEAGGDFYEVIDAPGRAIVVMGDVVGKGAPAAALSAVARVTLRTAGRLTGDPRAALDELNRVLRRRGGMSLCTVIAVALPSELPGKAEILLAGHPPPLLLRDGEVRRVGNYGPMLGVVEVADWTSADVELQPDDVLVLYTDGVLDSVLPGGERFGEKRLIDLTLRAGKDIGALADLLEEQIATLRLRDDIAMLAIRCPGAPALLSRGTLGDEAESVLSLRLAGGADAPSVARKALARALGDRVSEQVGGDALIVVSELATNAVHHGGARSDADELAVYAALLPGRLRLEVCDMGAGFEPGGHGPRADGGYGLRVLDRLATSWGVAGTDPVTVWVELER
jgi:PAS domain S-box-containing protein